MVPCLTQNLNLGQCDLFFMAAEEIRCVFDDNQVIILLISSLKPMLWVLIRIASLRRF